MIKWCLAFGLWGGSTSWQEQYHSPHGWGAKERKEEGRDWGSAVPSEDMPPVT